MSNIFSDNLSYRDNDGNWIRPSSLIFMDIDGVLNRHKKLPSGYCGIESDCRDNLNIILDMTNAGLVISSAWRYLINNGSMSLEGFQNMLHTHGVKSGVVGITRKDTMIPGPDGQPIPLPDERGTQIAEWLAESGWQGRYVVIDDGGKQDGVWTDMGIVTKANHPFVQTKSTIGLTLHDAEIAIEILCG